MKKLALLFLLCNPIWCQQTNTVFASLATNDTSGSVSIPLASKYSIGQAYHVVLVVFSDVSGIQQCTGGVALNPGTSGPTFDIYGSYDNVNFSPITLYTRSFEPTTQISATNRYRFAVVANGAFPFIKVIGTWANPNHCAATIGYTGTIQPIDLRKIQDFSNNTDQLNLIDIDISTATSTPLTNASLTNNCSVRVYGLYLYNGSATTANTILVQDLWTDTSAHILAKFVTPPNAQAVSFSNTNFPTFSTTFDGSIQITTTAATPVSGFMLYRCE